ncbi:MAG: alpha amylase C-terminal domain-containing protein, partial [Lachnospiraceae bacterium]|nr:alpha amylase C-terminal domain-containing protein [Lachnospiraceae bacterium]
GFTHALVSADFESLFITADDPKDMIDFTDSLHKAGISVLLRWQPASFPNTDGGLSMYDGTCIYEDGDGRRAYVPGSDRKYFNLGSAGVRDYILSNAVCMLDIFHFDGLVVSDVARMLYLDYGKQNTGWTPNMYGGNENLDAIDFFRLFTVTLHKYSPDVLLISDDDTAYPGITADVQDEGLGFDYKLDHGWSRDVLGYLKQEPLGRSNHYNEICFPMIYQYNESFILPLYDIADIWNGMPGDQDEKFGNLKSLIAYHIMHPGKKLFSGGMTEGKGREIKAVHTLIKDAYAFYNKNGALYSKEMEQAGFEWINNISARENILVFTRYGSKKDELFVVVVNFANVPHKGYKIGVPRAGRYSEVFTSDAEKYDGFGFVNKSPVFSEKSECDGRGDSIRIKVAPLSVAVFKYSAAKE